MKKTFCCSTLILGLGAMCLSCDGDETGQGTLRAEVWGEEFIEEGIPSEAFADGFFVSFDAFLVNLGSIAVAQGDGDNPDLEIPGASIWDLTESGPFEVDSAIVPAGEYRDTAYRIGPATGDSGAGNATADQVELMVDQGFSVYVAGTASDGSVTKAFHWGFTRSSTYQHCESTADLAPGESATVQITIHGDHLFYDDAVSEDPVLRWHHLAAADADSDGEVTREELLAYEITPLANYGVGNLEIDNLWDFIEHMTTTLGHIDGEGHCQADRETPLTVEDKPKVPCVTASPLRPLF